MISTVTKQPLSLIINKNENDSHPMLHLFSPTALKGDLTYVDNTYYDTNNISPSSIDINNNNSNRKSTDTSHLSINTVMLTKAIGILSSTKKLDLRSLNLNLLPTPIIHLSQLTLLDLSYNQLNYLPPTLKQLKQLKHLNLSHNQLDHLPNVICELPKLKTLDVSHNTKLANIPRSLSKANRLIYLDISYTNISALPSELCYLFTIRYEHCSRLIMNIEEGIHQSLIHHPPSLVELCARKIMSLPNYSSTLKLKLQQQIEEVKGKPKIYHHYLHHEEGKNEIIVDEIDMEIKKKKKEKSSLSYYHLYNNNVLKQKLKRIWQCKNKIKSRFYHHHSFHSKNINSLPSTSALLQLPNHLWDYMMKAQHCSFCGKLFINDFIIRYRIMKRSDETFLPIYYQLCSAHWTNESDRLLLQFSTPSKK